MDYIKRIVKYFKPAIDGEADTDQKGDKTQSKIPINRNHPPKPQTQSYDLFKITQRAIDVFLMSKNSNGEISGLSYWQTANGYTAISLHDAWQNKTDNAAILKELISQIPITHQGTFINEYNDDSMWWAMCLLEAYKIQSDQHWYLNIAREIWTHVNQSVVPMGKYIMQGMDMDGGVMWTTKQDEGNINSITTGLFAELSARLALLQDNDHDDQTEWTTSTQQLIDASARSLNWILRCRYRTADNIILDTININTNETIDWTFTYTTGQTIAACLALESAISQTGLHPSLPLSLSFSFSSTSTNNNTTIINNSTYLKTARILTKASLTRTSSPAWLNGNGILTESSAYGPENHNAIQNDDAVGFKSVLVRSLGKFLHYIIFSSDDDKHVGGDDGEDKELGKAISDFIFRQFFALQEHNTVQDSDGNGKGIVGQYGPWWDGPMDTSTSHSQLAVLDVLASIHLVYNNNIKNLGNIGLTIH